MASGESNNDQTRSFIALTAGMEIDHYKIISKLGAGGMGEVYLAEDTKLDRRVALKFLPAHLSRDEDCRSRFKREAQAAAALIHPNIVTIYEVSEFKGQPFFAMECCEGRPLNEIIGQEDLPLAKIIDLTLQICEGLQEAHEGGIVHRDIKPSNIMLDKKGRPKLVDFGLAAVRGTDKLTKTGSTLGTLGYMSPEQIQVKSADSRADLFSIGVLFYEMIAGQKPFKGDNEAATLNAVLNEDPEPLSRYKSGVSGDLQRIVGKLLEKDPDLRYQTAAGVVSDLKRLAVSDDKPEAKPTGDWWNRFVVTGAVLILGVVVIYWSFFSDDPGSTNQGKAAQASLVILPFENLGIPEDDYFADGITDEITARLAGIGRLRVISRTSAKQYRNSDKTVKQIGKELKVDYILEGTIRWDKTGDTSRVRIIPQLIRVTDDSHIWANTYERAITGVFAVQADIAGQIAEAMGVTLLEPEIQTITTQPTGNLEAYNYYLRGLLYWDERVHINHAIDMFEKAVELDSNFIQAYSKMAQMLGYAYINNINRTEEYYQAAHKAAEKAITLAAGHADGYLAKGYVYYYCDNDYDNALKQFSKALESQPNNSELLAAIGFVHRRQGHWEEALNRLQEVYRLDPRSFQSIDPLVRTLFFMHRLDEAKQVINDALKWATNNERAHTWKLFVEIFTGANTSETHTLLKNLSLYAERPGFEYWSEIVDMFLRDYPSALSRRSLPGGYMLADSVEFYVQKGRIYSYMDSIEISHTYFDSARMVSEARIAALPGSAFQHSGLALAYAGLGRKEEAVREGQRAVELLPVSQDYMNGSEMLRLLCEVYTMVGEEEEALELLEYLIEHPSMIQIHDARISPYWDTLRENPRFKALLKKYEGKYGV
ncbi:MAG: protein kinase [FCB group bacterium]|nr:protein kinase [FCB group bacterium]